MNCVTIQALSQPQKEIESEKESERKKNTFCSRRLSKRDLLYLTFCSLFGSVQTFLFAAVICSIFSELRWLFLRVVYGGELNVLSS